MSQRPYAALGAVLLAALAAAGCDRTPTSTAVNNTGNSASPDPARLGPSTAVAPVTGDTASPRTPAAASSDAAAAPASGAMAETATTGKVKAAIAADAGLRDADISVQTQDGVVTLAGSAKSQDQVALAMQLAQRQEGVSRVDNRIEVR